MPRRLQTLQRMPPMSGSMLRLIAAGALLLATGAVPAAQPAAPAAAHEVSISGLHVSGNKILNGRNELVRLRGVNKSGSEYKCLQGADVFDGPADAKSVAVLKSWAINIVRLPVNENCWLGINGVGGGSYRNAIARY